MVKLAHLTFYFTKFFHVIKHTKDIKRYHKNKTIDQLPNSHFSTPNKSHLFILYLYLLIKDKFIILALYFYFGDILLQ